MKANFRTLLGHLSVLALLGAVACGEDDPGTSPVPPAPDPEFTIAVSNETMTGADIVVEETTNTATYYVAVDNKADVDRLCKSDEEYIRMKLDFIRVMAGVNRMTVAEYLAQELKQGRYAFTESELFYDTPYYVGVFGLTEEGEVTAPLLKREFRTLTFAPSAECRFIIQESACTSSSIEAVVGASDPEVRYYVAQMAADDFADYDSLDEAVDDIIFSAELFDDVDWSDPSFTRAGRSVVKFEGLEAGTEYAIIVFGIDGDGMQTTEAAMERLSTLPE